VKIDRHHNPYEDLENTLIVELEGIAKQLREDLSELTTDKLLGRTLSENENKLGAQTTEGRYQIYIH
jgi:hypothetical protein